MTGGGGQYQVDENDETWIEASSAAQQTTDSIFGASENAIQLSGGDYNTLGNPGRTASLMPFNFVANQRAALIRQAISPAPISPALRRSFWTSAKTSSACSSLMPSRSWAAICRVAGMTTLRPWLVISARVVRRSLVCGTAPAAGPVRRPPAGQTGW